MAELSEEEARIVQTVADVIDGYRTFHDERPGYVGKSARVRVVVSPVHKKLLQWWGDNVDQSDNVLIDTNDSIVPGHALLIADDHAAAAWFISVPKKAPVRNAIYVPERKLIV